MYPHLGNFVAAFVDGYFKAKHVKRVTTIDIGEIRKDIREICSEKPCSYCGRNNKFKKNCEGCGAPL